MEIFILVSLLFPLPEIIKGSFSLVTLLSFGILAIANFPANGLTKFPTLHTSKEIKITGLKSLRVNCNVNWSHFVLFHVSPSIFFMLMTFVSEEFISGPIQMLMQHFRHIFVIWCLRTLPKLLLICRELYHKFFLRWTFLLFIYC